jgi:drug/metabolite transporter (DMT)-like permease
MLFGITAGLGLDLTAKWLLADYPLAQFVFLRSLFGLFFFVIAARWYGGFNTFRTRRWRWHLLRTLLATTTMFCFFYGLSQMPIVNALTIAFTSPLVIAALSVPFLGERVGWRGWLAVLGGFVGVLVVLRPGPGMFTPAAIALITASVTYAGLALTARKLAATESSLSLAVYVIAGPLLFSALLLPGNFVAPAATDWCLFAFAGLCSALAWIGFVSAYRRAPPAQLGPFEYTALVGAAVAGYLIWGEVPDAWVTVGAALIIASGLFIAYSQRITPPRRPL